MMPENSNWIDISVPLRTGMVHWPGDPEPSFERISDMDQGGEANVTFCRMSAHTGTHMDAPVHFLAGNPVGMDAFPFEAGIGHARVVAVNSDVITSREVGPLDLQPGARVLFKTRNSNRPWAGADFQTDYVGLDASAAAVLADRKVALVGIDYLSVGVYKGDGASTHRALLSAGIWIVEGLDLTRVEEGQYELVCLPLKIVGGDGSPARAILRPVP